MKHSAQHKTPFRNHHQTIVRVVHTNIHIYKPLQGHIIQKLNEYNRVRAETLAVQHAITIASHMHAHKHVYMLHHAASVTCKRCIIYSNCSSHSAMKTFAFGTWIVRSIHTWIYIYSCYSSLILAYTQYEILGRQIKTNRIRVLLHLFRAASRPITSIGDNGEGGR